MSHSVLPHAEVEGSVAPNESSVTVPLVIPVLPFMDVAAGEYGPAEALNPPVSIDLSLKVLAVIRDPKLEIKSPLCDEGTWILGFYLVDIKRSQFLPF